MMSIHTPTRSLRLKLGRREAKTWGMWRTRLCALKKSPTSQPCRPTIVTTTVDLASVFKAGSYFPRGFEMGRTYTILVSEESLTTVSWLLLRDGRKQKGDWGGRAEAWGDRT